MAKWAISTSRNRALYRPTLGEDDDSKGLRVERQRASSHHYDWHMRDNQRARDQTQP